jgi:hypothetical protein
MLIGAMYDSLLIGAINNCFGSPAEPISAFLAAFPSDRFTR